MAITIDLTSDDDEPASQTIDLTSVDGQPDPSDVSREPEVKVEDGSSTLAGSSPIHSGKSTPNTQDDNITQTESNPTDVGDLSPTNPHDQGGSSSDDDLSIGAMLARAKKRKHDSADVRTSESKFADVSISLTPKALDSLAGSQSLKPGFNDFFSVRRPIVNESQSKKAEQDEKSKTAPDEGARIQEEGHSAENANSQILNIYREEVFGQEKKKKKKKDKHRSDPKSQQEPATQHSEVEGQAFSIPAPQRSVSEAPEAVRPKRKIEACGVVRPSKAGEEAESEHTHKRRKHSSREDTASGSVSFAAASDATRSQAASVDRLQGHIPKTTDVERSRPAGRDKATNIPKDPTKYRPGDRRCTRFEKVTRRESRQKKGPAQIREKAHKSKRPNSGKQQGDKAYLVAAPNERGACALNGVELAAMAAPRPSENRSSRPVNSDWYRSPGDPREEAYGIESGTSVPRLPLDRAPLGQEMPLQEVRGLSDVDLFEPQQTRNNEGQQESRSGQTKLNTAQPSRRLEKVQQTMRLDNHEKILQDARTFFSNHPSKLAQQRKVILADSVPADVGTIGYLERRQMIKKAMGKRSGGKIRNATQRAEKRERDRQRQIESRRQKLEAQANQLFTNESERTKEKWIEDGLAKQRQVFMKNDQKREAEKSQGLLTVEDLDELGYAGSDPIDMFRVAAPKGKRHGIPVAEALEPGASLTLYVVYMSDPIEKGRKFRGDDMKRLGDQFLRKEDANKHAEKVLMNNRLHDSPLVSIQFGVGPEDGLLFGTRGLANGKVVICMVQRERQMSSKLDLRDIFVRKEIKEIYCPRFDVFVTDAIPKVFLEEVATRIDGDKKPKSKSKSKTPPPDIGEDEPEPGEKEHVDGDCRGLFSATATPEAEDAHDERKEADEDEDEDEGDDSDADSIDTNVTLEASQSGGNLRSLSWNDIEYMHEHVGSFTTLELANKEAVKVALERWQPRGYRLDAWIYYKTAIRPSLEEVWTHDLDAEEAKLEFEVPESEGHNNDRPWRFTYSTVYVKETRLVGPRDIGDYVVTGNVEGNGENSGEEDNEDGEDDGEDD